MAEFDINKVQGNDRFIAGGAIVMIIASFFPWRSVSVRGFGGGHVSAWGSGGYGWPKLAILLALVAGAIVIARLMGALDSVTLPAGINLITLAVTGLATVILLLQYVFGFKNFAGASLHPGFGYYVGILVSGAMTYFAFLNFKTSGEQLPTKPGSALPPATTPPGFPPPAAPVRAQAAAPPTRP
jgi:hypothetical protein